MNPFINPKQRDVSLPAGCKNLIDVLEREAANHDFKTSVTDVGFVITACLPGLRSEDIDITVEGDTVLITGNKIENHAPFEGVVHVPFGYNLSATHAIYLHDELRVIIPKSAA
jgi:HSP20 family molecular chaperone IbpA